ncbi:MAG TPA: hypothetical protein VHV78_09800 [Gemmatimonadaceae bacterium]|nr:hypothetical protein [Gemmatimonadaceae bacterium]
MPRLSPLTGAPLAASKLPRTIVPAGHRRIVFSWELEDRDMVGRGDGAARIAPPDSARLDFFLAGGFGGGAALLLGDSIQTPGGDLVRRLVPPPTLLWATLGRVALPNLPDTAIRTEGTTLRADIGNPVAWRLTFHGDTLVRAERVDNGKVAEWVERTDATHVQYRNEKSRRSLRLTVTRTEEVPAFDASIWHLDR